MRRTILNAKFAPMPCSWGKISSKGFGIRSLGGGPLHIAGAIVLRKLRGFAQLLGLPRICAHGGAHPHGLRSEGKVPRPRNPKASARKRRGGSKRGPGALRGDGGLGGRCGHCGSHRDGLHWSEFYCLQASPGWVSLGVLTAILSWRWRTQMCNCLDVVCCVALQTRAEECMGFRGDAE